MEPFTHLLTGACLGRAGFNRKTAYATLAMTLAAEAPDLDVLWVLRGPVTGFEHHRGITHTFLGAPFIALAAVGVVWLGHRLRRKPPPIAPRWGLLWAFAFIAVLSHLLLDYTNNYGLRPFFPFSPRWYAADLVFIFDPILFGTLLLGLLVPVILGWVDREMTRRRTRFGGRRWATAALIGIVGLWALRAGEHAHAIRLLEQANYGGETPVRIAAEPYPIDPFHWQGLVETHDFYQYAAVHTRHDTVETDEQSDRSYKATVTAAVRAAKQSYLGRVYLSWSQFPLVEDAGQGLPSDIKGNSEDGSAVPLQQVDFQDMRYGYSGWIGQAEDHKPLTGTVYVAPDGQIEAMYMDGKPQP